MAVRKTHQFLPDIFQTDTNKKFLNATLDQLISEPALQKINGYIGRKLSPSYKNKDSYIPEQTTDRQNYQLEPSLIIKNPISNNIDFATTYTDILNKLRYHGGITDKHSRLFDNEFYTYDPKIDLDKFVNFSQYYWLSNGPDAVVVSAENVPLFFTYDVEYDATTNSYSFTRYGDIPNPDVTLVRGGTYNFAINEPGINFFIQTKPGSTGQDPDLANLSTREILGLTNNGTDVGTVVFKVPSKSAQNKWTTMPIVEEASYATSLGFHQISGASLEELITNFGGIDGPVSYLENSTIVFTNIEYIADAFWVDTSRTQDGIAYFDQTNLIPFDQRTDVFNIRLAPDINGVQRVILVPKISVPNEHKIRVRGGATNAGREFYNRLGTYYQVPVITAPQDTLYYQCGDDADAVGTIRLVEPNSEFVDPDTEILGKTNYTSPNGVIFTNGLLISFDSTAPSKYQNKKFYVEGVGTAIQLIDKNELVSIESINASTVIDGGKGYQIEDRLTILGGTGTAKATAIVEEIILDTATATATINPITGVVTAITITNAGSGYLTAPTITIDSAPAGFNNAFATAVIINGVVTGISITTGGDGYIAAPKIVISAPTSGPIRKITIKDRGNYTALPKNPVTVSGGNGAGAQIDAFLQPETPQYFTIKRSSIDRNPWSRANRWVHMEVIEQISKYNDSTLVLNQDLRARRPIIEFDENLQLYNFGTEAKAPIDILDTTITNAFTQVQGRVCADTTVLTIGSLKLTTGDRVIFTNDINNDVKNRIYIFTIELTTEQPDAAVYKAYIREAEDYEVLPNNTVLVLSGNNGGKQWYYNGTNWKPGQEKTSTNQEPLFDIINDNGVSFSDISVYPGTNFVGNKIFSYKRGSTINDDIIGLPLSYKNFVSQGDIEFNNLFDTESFTYLIGGGGIETVKVNSGYLQKNITVSTCQRQNIWTINKDFSHQHQIYNFVYDGVTNLFPIDHAPDNSILNPNIKVYVNNKILEIGNFAITKVVDRIAILVNPDLINENDVIFISVYTQDLVAPSAYYEVPLNLDINGLNTNLETLTLGQIRNHLIALKNNSLNVTGSVPGKSNLRDIQYLNNGGSILQHSAPVVYAGLFLTHPTMNFVNAIQLANREYTKFKIKFIELSSNLELNRNDIPGCVDSIMDFINKSKNDSFPWYYSDMVPNGTNERNIIPTYTVLDPDIKTYEISRIFDDTKISNRAVLVYLTRTINAVETKTLLIKNRDFFFRQDRPAITIQNSFGLLYGDKIDIVEYNNTDGSYVPETPTKMGMYPKYYPEIYVDNTYRTPITVIQGHDGSVFPAFNDFRDIIILELERRIYNNIKVEYDPNVFNLHDVIPGKFRPTDYSREEFTQILSKGFLSYIGTNRLDFTTNEFFKASDPFTWNYKNFRDGINGQTLPGTWRSIYQYYYDTDRPHTHPWEMLGFSEKPDYWDDRYGPAPYTGGNAVLWNDISLGYIAEGDRAGFDIRYQRPNLSYLIPVDENGNLKPPTEIGASNILTLAASDVDIGQTYTIKENPVIVQGGVNVYATDFISMGAASNEPGTRFIAIKKGAGPGLVTVQISFSLVADFDSSKANRSFAIGDLGPAEHAWRKSSEYPYSVQLALALAKPAKFFALCANLQNYIRNPITGQFEISSSGQHLTPQALLVHGQQSGDAIERTAGYINWIRDYVKNLGIQDAAAIIKNNLYNLDVQLAYKMAGYTDKKFVELLAEQRSPSSINDSVIVPEENYRIELYKGAPVSKITYSAVIVERSAAGYTVSGFDLTNPYFFIIPSQVNNNAYTVTSGKQRGVIYKDFKKAKYTIPYGFEFNSRQQVVDFLVGYQRYLLSQGFVFTDRDSDLGEQKDWILSVKEFLHWSEQGWKAGSIIVLSPVSTTLKVFDTTAVVDEIKNTPFGSRIIDINFKPIVKNNFTIIRESNEFVFKSNADQTIGFAELDLVQYEHLLILDNVTVFNDVIYVPELGNRQYRLKLVGAKTTNWNGSLELPGFIYSSNKVDEWEIGKDYLKGAIVRYKFRFYTALQNIPAAIDFQTNYWKQIAASELKSGIVNNFATNAAQGLNFYDIDNQPLNEEVQTFSNGLIGFRTRSYFSNLGIDINTQSKFYQGLIKQKGTVNAINALKGAVFGSLDTSLNFYENWALRIGEYGATDINNFYEIELNESLFGSNPTPFQLIDDTVVAESDVISFKQTDIYKSSGAFNPNIVGQTLLNQPLSSKPLPVAGYVYLDDIDATIFDLNEYATLTTIVNNIGIGYKIWVARDFNKNWNVLRATLVNGMAFAMRYIVDEDVEVVFDRDHGVEVDDLVVIKNFDARFDGVYKVKNLIDTTRFTVTMYQNLQQIIDEQAVVGTGIMFVLTSCKITYASEVESIRPVQGWIENDKIWVDQLDANGNWGVYNKIDPWKFVTKAQLDASKLSTNDHFGQSISLDRVNGRLLYVGAPDSGTGRAAIFTRTSTNGWSPSSFFWGNSNGLDSYGKVVVNGNGYFCVAAPDSSSGIGYVYVYKDATLIQVLTDSTGAASDYFGSAMAMSEDGFYLYVSSPGADKVFCYALESRVEGSDNFTGDGATTTFTLPYSVTDPTEIVVFATLRSAEFIPTVDYTVSGTSLIFNTPPDIFDRINVIKRTSYYTSLGYIQGPVASNFGASVSCNRDASVIAIGANKESESAVDNEGSVYVYHRTITEFTTDGFSGTFTSPDSFNNVVRVFFNNVELVAGTDFYFSGVSTVQFPSFSVPTVGQRVKVETNQFILDQKITAVEKGIIGQQFGSSTALCNTGCNIYSASPFYAKDFYDSGSVIRLINNGRVYGRVTATKTNPTVTPGHTIVINNRSLTFNGSTLDSVVTLINAASIPGVTAAKVGNKLQISSDVLVANDKLDIKAGSVGTALNDLGINIYEVAQMLKHPNVNGEKFGTSIALSQATGKLAIGSDGADITVPTTFDSAFKTTVFDSNSTTFVALAKDSGAVYIFDLMENPFQSQDNPAYFAFTQKLTGPDIDTGFNFGASISVVKDILVVGAVNDYEIVSGGGSVYSYYNENTKSGWQLTRYNTAQTDPESINSVFVYNKKTQQILNFLDVYDPAKGKLLGVVDQELDYKEEYDPASYNTATLEGTIQNSSFYWSNKHVGKTWWDTSQASFINYEQGSLQYRAKNWGSLFPGSKVRIYEWIESDFLPSQYVVSGGDGIPKYSNNSAYTSVTNIDPATGIIYQKYYYWVSDRTGVDSLKSKRELSISTLEKYISAPKDQNIAYIGALARNSFNLYNISQGLISNDIVLHIEVAQVKNSNLIHNEYQLIQQGNPISNIPLRILNKIKESLMGFDSLGKLVPDTSLTLEDSIGILVRPRQAVFLDKLAALENFVIALNKIYIRHPVLFIANATKMFEEASRPTEYEAEVLTVTEITYLDTTSFADGYRILIPEDAQYNGRWTLYVFDGISRTFELRAIQSYKTTLFWSYADWYSQDYEQGNVIDHVVTTYGAIQTLVIAPDDYVKVLDDGAGNWLIYRVEQDLTLTLIAAQNACLQIKDTLYNPLYGGGFDSIVFDVKDFDPQAGIEVGKIFDSAYSQILIDSLAYEFNDLFFSLINYIFAEQKNPDWIFKTSFIDVLHNLRTLEQIPNYVKDNQNFYEDYINEVKPYRTKLREYVPQYIKLDEAVGEWTDFDNPSIYIASENTYRSPNVQAISDTSYFNNAVHKQYSDNYKFKVSDFIIGNIGSNFSVAPNIEISGGGGSGATAIATVNATTGSLTAIKVINPGSGYTSTPTVTINGVGSGAIVYPLLNNEYQTDGSYNTVRDIITTIKFDRITYTSNVVQWQPNTAYSPTVVVDGNLANAWDINRISFKESNNIGLQDTDVTEVFFKPDGYKMYVVGNTTDRIYEYQLSVPWDISTASNIAAANVKPQDTNVQGLYFRDDGYYMYTVGATTDSVYEYRLATAWAVNTAANVSVKSVSTEEASPRAIEFSRDGTRLYVVGALSDTIYQYSLSIPWEVETATYSSLNFSVVAQDTTPTALRFRPDGTQMFVLGQQNNKIYRYTLSTPWNVNTASFTGEITLDTTSASGMFIRQSGINLYVTDSFTDTVRDFEFSNTGINIIDSNVYIATGNIIYYNNIAYIATNANVSSQTVFDYSRYSQIDDGNILLSAADRIMSFYTPELGRPGKSINQLMFGTSYPGVSVIGKEFVANSFSFYSNNIGFSYTGMKITSANIAAVDFVKLGFDLDQTIRVEGLYEFDFVNNADFQIISVEHDEMMVSGPPIESIYTLTLSGNVTNVQAGDYITQANTLANARILHNYTSANVIQVIHSVTGFAVSSNVVSINGSATSANVMEIITGGTANVSITNLYIDDLLDSNIVSFYTDTAIGTRPEDINIVGGAYVDGYNSHAPEELIPGRVYDALELRVFTNTAANTASYGFREFIPLRGNIEFYRISANSTTTLTANLGITDIDIFVSDASLLPDPGPAMGRPGEVFINGEQIHYYQKYDTTKILTALPWTANTIFAIDSLIAYGGNTFIVLGNVYANSTAYISNTSVRKVYVNSLSQLRRGVDGTGIANVHLANSKVVDSSLVQVLPNANPSLATVTGTFNTAANVTWRISLSAPITTNAGSFITQLSTSANARILGNVLTSNVIAVQFVAGNLSIGSNSISLVNSLSGTLSNTSITVKSMDILGQVDSNGNVTLVNQTITRSNLWVPLGSGVGLGGSTSAAAEFIRDEVSYQP